MKRKTGARKRRCQIKPIPREVITVHVSDKYSYSAALDLHPALLDNINPLVAEKFFLSNFEAKIGALVALYCGP